MIPNRIVNSECEFVPVNSERHPTTAPTEAFLRPTNNHNKPNNDMSNDNTINPCELNTKSNAASALFQPNRDNNRLPVRRKPRSNGRNALKNSVSSFARSLRRAGRTVNGLVVAEGGVGKASEVGAELSARLLLLPAGGAEKAGTLPETSFRLSSRTLALLFSRPVFFRFARPPVGVADVTPNASSSRPPEVDTE